MILLITYAEYSEKAGKQISMVSHGIDTETDKTVVLPVETLDYFTRNNLAYYSEEYGGYVLREPDSKAYPNPLKADTSRKQNAANSSFVTASDFKHLI